MDRIAAVDVLRRAVELGIDHIDTSFAYGPRFTNEIIEEALEPYPDSLCVATKVGATRDESGGWPPARRPDDIRRQVHENLESLGLRVLDVVYLRLGDASGTQAGSIVEPFQVLVDMQREGFIRHLGVSNATPEQVSEAMALARIVSVQNMYNLAFRGDDALIDTLAAAGIAYVPFFPLGGFSPLQSDKLSKVADRLCTTPQSVALAWLLQRSPNILLIPGTSSVNHLVENLHGAAIALSPEDVAELDTIANS